MFSRELRLRSAISLVENQYDYIFVDCPPSLGMLTINSLAAVNEVIVPLQCEYDALEGLGQLLTNVQLIQEGLNPDLQVSAIVLVMFDARTRLAGKLLTKSGNISVNWFSLQSCRDLFVCPAQHGQPIEIYDPASAGAAAYRAVTKNP